MKWAILSDIHGNLEALEAVLDCISKEDILKLAFLGDVVGYGANPNECLDIIKDRADVIIAGNHDYAVAGLTDISSFNALARKAIEWTKEHMPKRNRSFLSGVSLINSTDDLTFVHSTPYNPQEWGYLFSLSDVIQGFNSCNSRICFVGHSHIPAVFIKDSKGMVYPSGPFTIHLKEGCRYIINVGSVGQPRDAILDAAFGVYDTEEFLYTIKRVPYDITTAQKKILESGLPEYLARRIAIGA
ncbi:MAG: metallophosphoesterase family protein [Thermodesulfobacteriota bacterium]|nr:metallophosphoesterase family protein [Thermodesulfobacteriota bacterium]